MPPKLGIVAGSGRLPDLVLRAARASGRDVFLLAIEGAAEPVDPGSVEHAHVPLGSIGRAIRLLHGAEVRDVCLVGGVPPGALSSLRPDLRAVRLLAGLGRTRPGGDVLLRLVLAELEREGFRVVGADAIAPDLVVRGGPLTRVLPDPAARPDIETGIEAVRHAAWPSVGQAVVVCRGDVVGIEDAAGTDALLMRCSRECGETGGCVLVKVSTPGQDPRVDLPTIGPETVAGAKAASLDGIAVEADRTLIVDRLATVAAANAAGLFVVGVRVDG